MIQKNIVQKLSGKVLAYQCVGSLIPVAVFSLVAAFFLPQYASWISPVAVVGAIVVLAYLSIFLNWKFFEYTITDINIIIRSGVIVRSANNVNFNDIQNARVVYGPIAALFGVKKVMAFTASPAQVQVHSGRQGTTTSVRPDVAIVLPKDDAEELLKMMQGGDVQKVQMVS